MNHEDGQNQNQRDCRSIHDQAYDEGFVSSLWFWQQSERG
jgi:hypothetical protein